MHPVLPRIDVPELLVERVRELFDSNRPLQALAATEGFPLDRWPWGAPAVLASRVMSWLGAARAASRLRILNHRHARWHDEAWLYWLFQVQESRGVLASLRATEQILREHPFDDDPTIRFDVLSHLAQLLSVFRDFPRAYAAIDEAIAAFPERPWFPATKAMVLMAADRREEAIEWADRALEVRPGYRLAVLHKADALIQLGRLDEAVGLLEHELAATEVAAYAGLLQSIASERDDAVAALAALEEFRRRQPLLEQGGIGAYQARRADLLLRLGDLAGASEAAALSNSFFHKEVAARLSAPGAAERRRVRLNVPFVRQHHLTCAPATLAALSAFWGRPANHLEIAEKICYDGTPHFHQRVWAEQNGFVVAEFTVSYSVTKAVIDAGIPFAMATTEPTSSHLQAVIGYDDRNGVVIMRDPTSSHFTEALAEPYFLRFGATGPLGMILIPAEEASRLEGLDLPDRHLHDLAHALAGSLETHQRDEAARCFDALEKAAPGHRIVELARLSLAGYDADMRAEELAATRLHAMFPEDQWATFTFFRLRSRTAPHAESIALLDSIRLTKDAAPVFELQHAFLLAADGRRLEGTEKSFRRYLRFVPQDVTGLSGLADTLAASNRHVEALDVRRLAATVDDTNETTASLYFSACRQLNRAEEGLEFLRNRFEAYGSKSAGPAIAAFQAYEALERREEGFRLLDVALAKRPDDGLLQLFLADALGAVGRLNEAREALDTARSKVSKIQWLRRAAIFSARVEDNAAARGHWEALLALNPLDADAQRAVISLTAEIDGIDAALQRLSFLASQHPEFHPLLELQSEWYLREGKFEDAGRALRRIIADFPLADWPYRGLSHILVQQGKHDESIAAARHAIELAPHLTYSHGQLGEALAAARRFEEAGEAFRRSLELSIDNAASMRGLLEACPDAASRLAAVAFLREQLVSQTTSGTGVLSFADIARLHLEPEELRAILEEARGARPDLVATWTALTDSLIDRGDFDAARAEATAMLARFPYAPATHRLLSIIEQRSGNLRAAESAWRQALHVVPGWTYAMRCLGETLEGLGRLEEAIGIYRRAVAYSPLEAANHGMLADVLWRTSRREEALASVERAVLADPAYHWAWGKLREWAESLGTADAALETSRELTRRRPSDPRSWLALAETAWASRDFDLAVSALEEGLAIAPMNIELWDTKATILVHRGDLVGALAACTPSVFDGRVPRELRGRRCWVLIQAGKSDEAGAELDAVIAEQPDYVFARSLRYDMHSQREEFHAARRHAAHLARLVPSDPVAHGRVAETWIREGQLDKAIPSLRRALSVDPSYTYAVRHLLDHATDQGDPHEVENVLAHARRFLDPVFTLRCEVVARAALAQKPLLAKAFSDFLRLENIPVETADEVYAAALGADPKPVRTMLEKAVTSGSLTSGSLVRVWVGRHTGTPASVAARLRKAKLPSETAEEGWDSLLYCLDATTINGFLTSHRRDYQAGRLWAAAGARLAALGHRRAAGRWFADWKSHPGLEPDSLIDAIHAIEAHAGPIESAPLRRLLMSSPTVFRDRYLHAVGLAWTEAREGNGPAARQLLQGIDPSTLVAYYQAVFHFTQVLLSAIPDDRPAGERREAIVSHWAEAKAVCDTYNGDPALRWYKRLTAKHAAKHPDAAMLSRFAASGLWGWLRSWW